MRRGDWLPSRRFHASIRPHARALATTLTQGPLDMGSVDNVFSLRLLDVEQWVSYALLETKFRLDFIGWTSDDLEVSAP